MIVRAISGGIPSAHFISFALSITLLVTVFTSQQFKHSFKYMYANRNNSELEQSDWSVCTE
jgi:hypothetical protein